MSTNMLESMSRIILTITKDMASSFLLKMTTTTGGIRTDPHHTEVPTEGTVTRVGGNLVAVQACRISTYLHQRTKPDSLSGEELCISPFVAWFGNSIHSKTCRILILLAVPGHLIFISCVHFLKSTYTPLTAEFLLFYVIAALLQVAILLYAAHCFVHYLWKWGFDPDDAAIPYLTALGDLLGTAFLFLAFLALEVV